MVDDEPKLLLRMELTKKSLTTSGLHMQAQTSTKCLQKRSNALNMSVFFAAFHKERLYSTDKMIFLRLCRVKNVC